MSRASEMKFVPEYVTFKIDLMNKRIVTDNSVMDCDSISYYPASDQMAAKIEAAGFVIHVGKDTVRIGNEVFATRMDWGFDTELQAVNGGESKRVISDVDNFSELTRIVARHWKLVVPNVFTVYARQVVL